MRTKVSASFFSILCLRCHFSTVGGCLVLSKTGSAVPWSSWKGASAASSHCFPLSCALQSFLCWDLQLSSSTAGSSQEQLYTAPLLLRRQQPWVWNNHSCCIHSSGGRSSWALPSLDLLLWSSCNSWIYT